MSGKGKYSNGTRGRQLSPMADSEAHSTVMEFIDCEYQYSFTPRGKEEASAVTVYSLDGHCSLCLHLSLFLFLFLFLSK